MVARAVERLLLGRPAKKYICLARYICTAIMAKCLKDKTLALGDDIFDGNPVVLDME